MPRPKNFNINSRTVVAPLAAFTMAILLFVYARTSIQAAKRNAQKHREADGGQISWRNETQRRHGARGIVEEKEPIKGLLEGIKAGEVGIGPGGKGKGKTREEVKLERVMRKG